MTPLSRTRLRGNWATLLLPIDERDGIDFATLRSEIDLLIAAGVDGIYSNGTAGEFFTQSEDEFDAVNELLAARCQAAGMPFQIGVSHMSPQISLSRLHRARQLAPSAMQIILPDWVPPTDGEVMSFMQRICEAAHPIGVVLYNPPHAKRVLPPAMFARLANAFPALVGIKCAGGDDAWYRDMQSSTAGLSLFIPGHHLATGLARGAHGAYSNVACIDPTAAQAWYELILRDPAAGTLIQDQIQAFLTEYVLPLQKEGYCNAALDKSLAAIGDWCAIGTRLRWPYRSVDPAQVERLRPIARRQMADFFALARSQRSGVA